MNDSRFKKHLGSNYQLNRFASKEETIKHLEKIDFNNIKEIKLNHGGFPVYSDGQEGYVDIFDNHYMITGSTGSMKSRAGIMPTVISLGLASENMVVLDPKGEITHFTSGYLKSLGYEVKVINFRDLDHSDCYNPLYEPYHLMHDDPNNLANINKAKEMINDIASIFVEPNIVVNGTQDPYWTNSSREFIDGLINLVVSISQFENECNLGNIAPFINNACIDNDDDVYRSLRHFIHSFPDYYSIKQKLMGTLFNANNTKNCIISEAKSSLSPFYLNRQFEKVISNNTINLRDFAKEDKKIALFIITPDEKDTYNTFCSIFIKQLYTTLIDEAEKKVDKKLFRRTNFILDEFPNIAKIPSMSSMISAARSRNIRLFLVIQSNSQLEAKYGELDASTIKTNCQNWVYLNSKEKKVIYELIDLIGEDPSKPNKHEYLNPSDLLDLKKHFPYVKSLLINQEGKPFVTELADISLYTSVIKDGKPIYPEVKPLTPERVVSLMDVRILDEYVSKLENKNKLLALDGMPPLIDKEDEAMTEYYERLYKEVNED